ncbi:MAG: 1-deoxy-D-xylulose-5-phosphate synthase [Oscillospiraceae bacterium]|nr:1-deoxy-D-xylulose-5-phosphate synthase [Oscillospiraceae bacterium]
MKDNTTVRLKELDLPSDLKKLSIPQCVSLCREIRDILISTVAENGGHLASNLGTVELTMAIHRVFCSPYDKIIWDVGHQAYTHKILTGRLDEFSTLRTEGGISGFAKPSESEHDIFISGHSSNSISAACGIARAMRLQGDDHNVIAVIGDGAFTGGMVYEGLNNAGKSDDNLIVILNDNEMSISKNVGALAKYLSSLRGRKAYVEAKKSIDTALDRTPVIGKPVKEFMLASKDTVRWFLYRSSGQPSGATMFENLGFIYLGPVDGHDLKSLEETLKAATAAKKPVLIHVNTVKGKGYRPAEKNPGAFHGLAPMAMKCGDPEIISSDSFSAVFGEELAKLGSCDKRICGITAAMKYGTGLNRFAQVCPDRFFDVGIAEQHAVTFAAGLAVSGMIPVFAVYSSFLQRGYDQIIHDAAICRTHIVLAIDRAGIVGEDGETHQGLFDVPMLTGIPNITAFSPSDYNELRLCLRKAIYDTASVAAVRYPRGSESGNVHMKLDEDKMLCFENNGGSVLAVGYGRTGADVWETVRESGLSADVLKLVRIFPLENYIIDICMNYEKIIIFEESLRSGGIGEHIAAALSERGHRGQVKINAVRGFVKQAKTKSVLGRFCLDKVGIEKKITELIRSE